MNRISVLAVAAMLLAGAIGWQSVRATSVMPLPLLYTLGGDFTLPSTLGREVSLADFHGEVVLLNFGFTNCSDVCPTAMARMRDVVHALPEEPLRGVFVTLDPAHDSIDRLAPFVAAFDAQFVGLTGTDAQINGTAARYRVYRKTGPADATGNYGIVHSGQIYLLDGDGRVRATFGESVTVEAMVATVRRLLAEMG